MTEAELAQGVLLKEEIDAIEAQLTTLNKLTLPWGANFPDVTVTSRLIFRYQKVNEEFEEVEIIPSVDNIESLEDILSTMHLQLTELLEEKEAELAALGE